MADVYVVDVQYGGEYIDDTWRAYIQIFGRRSTGESVCVRVRGFRPYFYCLAPSALLCSAEEAAQSIAAPLSAVLNGRAAVMTQDQKERWKVKRGEQMAAISVEAEAVRRTPTMHYHEECDMLRVVCSHPNAVAPLRDAIVAGEVSWNTRDPQVGNITITIPPKAFEANLEYALRYMVDNDVRCNAWIRVENAFEASLGTTCTSPDLVCIDPSQIIAYSDDEEKKKGLVPSLTLMSVDIECGAEKGLFPDPNVDPVIDIACDIVRMDGRTTSEIEADAKGVLFALKDTSRRVVGEDVDVRCFYDERQLLLAYAEFIRMEADPDVITSWNGPNFDWKYIVNRCAHLGCDTDGATKFSRIQWYKTRNRELTKSTKAFGTTKDNEVMMPGRVIFDLLTPVRKNYKERSYTLNAISKKFLGEHKDPIKHTEITELWRGTPEDRGKLGHYCFTTEHQLLTNKGFMFLDEFERRHKSEADLLAASYYCEGDTLVYERATAVVVNAARAQTVIEISNEGERIRWDGAGENVDVRTNGISLVVTPDHDMFAKFGKRSQNAVIPAGSTRTTSVTSYAWEGAYAKVKASELASSGEVDICRFRALARNGIKVASAAPPAEFATRLSLDTDEKVDAFLELYGFWLGGGSMDTHRAPASGAVTFAQVKTGDTAWIIKKLTDMGLKEGTDWKQHKMSASGQVPITVRNKALFAYLFEEYGSVYAQTPTSAKRGYAEASGSNQDTPQKRATTDVGARAVRAGYISVRSARWFMNWAWTLEKRRARLVIGGLRLADGTAACIFTSSVLFRDEIVRLLLHAGYSATFKMEYEAGTRRVPDWRGTPIVATHDAWRVAFATSAQFAEPVVRRNRDVREVPYSGKTWCLTMPSGFVIARRARIDSKSGSVVLASRPTIQGNCVQDARLPRRILLKKQLWIQYAEMARVCRVPTTYLVTKGEQIKVFTQLCYKARQRGFVVDYIPPQKKKEDDKNTDDRDVGYQGATVIEPARGFYDRPIATLDFTSLYPSIMMAHGLCYITHVLKDRVKDFAEGDIEISPTGDAFVKPHVRKGLLPEVLQELGAARKAAKALMLAAEDAGDTASQGVYDKRQLALKVSANSVYGFTGVLFGRLPLQPIARSVTAYGREMIEMTKEKVEESGPPGTEVIYGDTDSVMIKYPCSVPIGANGKLEDVKAAIAESRAFALQGADAVNAIFMKPINLDYEKVFYPYLLISKKRYAGCLFEKPAAECLYLATKGIESQRRDNAQMVPRILDDVLTCLMDDLSPERAIHTAVQAINAIVNGPVTPDDIINTIADAAQTTAIAIGNPDCDIGMRVYECLTESYNLGMEKAQTPHTMKEEWCKLAVEAADGFEGAATAVTDTLRCNVTREDYVMSKAYSRPLDKYDGVLPHTEVLKNMARREDDIAIGYRKYLGDRIEYIIIAPCLKRPETYDDYVRVNSKDPTKLKGCIPIGIETVFTPVDPSDPNGDCYEARRTIMGKKKKTKRTADRAEDPEWALANEHVPDAVYYIEKQLANPIVRLLKALVGSKKAAIQRILNPVKFTVRPEHGFYPTRLDADIKDALGIQQKRKPTPSAQEQKETKEWKKQHKGDPSSPKRPRKVGPLDAFFKAPASKS